MFEGGYSLNKEHFFRNIVSIVVFAVVGTLISTLVVGGGLALFGKIGICYDIGFLDNMIYGALISAVDPVATLAIFNALDVSPMLNMMVFGESVLNDAVSVVLFRTLLNFKSHTFNLVALAVALGQFLVISLGSVVLGLFTGFTTAFLFRSLPLHRRPSMEVVLVLVISYMSYFVAESLQLSGIMTILTISILMNHYVSYSMSDIGKHTLEEVSKCLSFICDSGVFAYLGASVFTFNHHIRFDYIIAAIVLCILGRLLNVYPLTAVLNCFRTYRIPQKFQFIQFFSGLRGAVAFALVLTITGPSANILITTTLGIVLFTIIVFGGLTLPLLQILRVRQVVVEPAEKLYEAALRLPMLSSVSALFARLGLLSQHALAKNAVMGAQPAEYHSSFENFDIRYLQPLFRKTVPLGTALSNIVNRMARRQLVKPVEVNDDPDAGMSITVFPDDDAPQAHVMGGPGSPVLFNGNSMDTPTDSPTSPTDKALGAGDFADINLE